MNTAIKAPRPIGAARAAPAAVTVAGFDDIDGVPPPPEDLPPVWLGGVVPPDVPAVVVGVSCGGAVLPPVGAKMRF